jgi:hypothetical protein
MDFFEIIDRVKFFWGKYMWPAIFLVVGLILLRMALVPDLVEIPGRYVMIDGVVEPLRKPVYQNSWFLYASLFFIVASVVWVLYLLKVINTTLGYGVLTIMAVFSVYLLYQDYTNIKTTVDYIADFDERETEIKTRLDDIKQAQIAFEEKHGYYAKSMDELIDYVKNGTKMKIFKQGAIPERRITEEEMKYLYDDNRAIDNLMTEREAALLANSPFAATDTTGLADFKRDTSYVSVMDAIFKDKKRVEARKKIGGQIPFHPDSMRYIPFTKEMVWMDTASVIRGEDLRVSTVEIRMFHPMADSITYSVGSLTENHLRESWRD